MSHLILKSPGKLLILAIFLFACNSSEEESETLTPGVDVQVIEPTATVEKPVSTDAELVPCSCEFNYGDSTYREPVMRAFYNGSDLAFCGPTTYTSGDTIAIFEGFQLVDCWREKVVIDYNRPNWTVMTKRVSDISVEMLEYYNLPAGQSFANKSMTIFQAFIVMEPEYGIYSFMQTKCIVDPNSISDNDWSSLPALRDEQSGATGKGLTAETIQKFFLWAVKDPENGRSPFVSLKEYKMAAGAIEEFNSLLSILNSYEAALEQTTTL